MECYICHKLVERHEFTRHVGSHPPDHTLAAHGHYATGYYDQYGATSTAFPHPARPANADGKRSLNDREESLEQLSADDNQEARPRHSLARATPSPEHASRHGTPRRRSTQPNAFQVWFDNFVDDSPKYTTIDGQRSKPDLDSDAQLRQVSEVLRHTTREGVVGIVKEYEGMSSNDQKACLELVQKVPIFPGLVAYTYTHLIACPRRGWYSRDDWSFQASELKQLVESWTRYGSVWCILSCDTIKNRLLDVLAATNVRPKEHKCNSALLNGTTLLDVDILNLAALVALCITGSQKKQILDQRGPQVEKLIELFHDLLEAKVELKEEYRRLFFNPLIKFSKDSGYCPRGIYLEEGTVNDLLPEARGGFGIVCKGRIGSRLVAVKVLARGVDMGLSHYNEQIAKEAIVWMHLRHPNCLPLYGIYRMPMEGPNLSVALVSPWMEQGTLSKYLEANPNANRTLLILDVVRGLNYLHSMQPRVAHRDLKPDNILITKNGRACLADFGLVSAFDTYDHFHTAPSQTSMCGTYHYMAPEIFNADNEEKRRKVNKRKCDMYALGCTIYAAYTGKHPFQGLSVTQLITNVISDRRPDYPKDKIPLDMWSFVENLWDADPLKRLTAPRAVRWMETKVQQEGVDSGLAPLEEEWEWKGPHDDKWSVSFSMASRPSTSRFSKSSSQGLNI